MSWSFPTSILYVFLFSPIHDTCPAHLILHDLIILIIPVITYNNNNNNNSIQFKFISNNNNNNNNNNKFTESLPKIPRDKC
jgi:hypothetical protein